MTDYSYLQSLIDQVREIRKQTAFQEIDLAECAIFYMPTKKTSYVGFRQGCRDQLIRSQNGMTESDKIRSTTKDYLRYIRNANGELLRIDSFNKGRVDCVFQVCRTESVRYLLPFSENGGYYPTYAYATRYEAGRVAEEYMVNGNQIVYEAYSYTSDNSADYFRINYVAGGNYPVRETEKGIFYLSPLSYEETFSDTWLNHR
ncbi:MAG: hypothetical protein E7559_09770 [Ruminococcaceae bacterium]|nr:hypothetical protein [Oscillospiraceae bacterium]